MAYTNSVGIMPGAATEKLPFVHSDFKPRSKFAKSFGGFKKFTRHGNGALARYEGQKLPVIHYSVENQRNMIAMGTKDRGDKPEYPGFSGTKRLLKKKDNSSTTNTTHPAISGSFTRSQSNAMKHYLSLPNLNLIHHQQQTSDTGAFHNFCSPTNYYGKNKHRHHKHGNRDPEDIQFINYLQQLQQQHQQQQQNNRDHNKGHNMDSLFIIDDDDNDYDNDNDDIVVFKQQQQQHNKTMIVGNEVRFKDPLVTTTAHTHQHDSFHRGSPNSTSIPGSGGQEVMDPFTIKVDKKLRDARGKSGMKRDRRREPDHMRVLGDVVTAERMNQLLLPRKSDAPLTFEENV